MTDYAIQLLGAQELDNKTLQQVNGLLHLLNPEASTIEAGRLALLIEEGRLMREYALGSTEAGAALTALAPRVEKNMNYILRGK